MWSIRSNDSRPGCARRALAIGPETQRIYNARQAVDNGVDTNLFHPGAKTPEPRILFVGTWGEERGKFLFNIFTRHVLPSFPELLPQYPFGAGLGRWGMINQYFGDNSDPKRKSIYVEIMWTGWLLDGGVPLIAAYVAALALAFITAIRITLIRGSDLWLAGALLVAYNVGALAATFVSPFFMAQGGMELWLLNAALFAAARGELQAKSARRPDTLFNRTGRDPRLGNWRPVQSLAKKNLA